MPDQITRLVVAEKNARAAITVLDDVNQRLRDQAGHITRLELEIVTLKGQVATLLQGMQANRGTGPTGG